jgi:DNA-binding IscR family transcriptional regulator
MNTYRMALKFGQGFLEALARDARTITAFEVIKSIDGPVLITSCTTKHGDCEQSLRCTVREPLRKVNESIQDVLSRITIAEMKDATHVHETDEKEKPAAELVGITATAN